jgi:hypothetical protein
MLLKDSFALGHRAAATLTTETILQTPDHSKLLMPLERLNEKESQRRYPVDHGAGHQLALGQLIGLIAAKFVGPSLSGDLPKYLANSDTTRK